MVPASDAASHEKLRPYEPHRKIIIASPVFRSPHNPLYPTMSKSKPSGKASMFAAAPPREPLRKGLTNGGVAGF